MHECDVYFTRNSGEETELTPMRLNILALFLCASVMSVCQSFAPTPKTSARVDENRQGTPGWTDCEKSTSDFSVSKPAPRQGERQFNLQAWPWDNTQLDAKNAFHSQFLFPIAQSCPFNQDLLRSFHAKLESPPPQAPNLKFEPIPTQWPNARFEPIPTDWPGLKLVPLASQPSAPRTPAK
jgi:hypothetical protein